MSPLSTDTLRERYRRDGFVAIEGLLAESEVEALTADAAAIARGERGAVLGSAPAPGASDDDVLSEILAIHFPHKISSVMRAAMRHPKVIDVLTALVGPNVKAMQTMLFIKRAGKPGQAWHQDEFFIPTRDRSLCGVWIALDDATTENGCLWMLPGSHASGVLWPMKPHSDARFDASEEAIGFPYAREGGIPVELKKGGVAFFNGYVLHRSLANTASDGFRRALVTHYSSAETLLPWSLGRSPGEACEDFRDIELIAGADPYAWKGGEDLVTPFVRHADPARAEETREALREDALQRRRARADLASAK